MPPRIHPDRRGPGLGGGWDLASVDVWLAEVGRRARRLRQRRDPRAGSTTCTSTGARPGRRLRPARPGRRPSGRPASASGSSSPTAGPRVLPRAAAWSSSSTPTAPPTRRRSPDVRMAWPGTDPLAFYRSPDRRGRPRPRRAPQPPRRHHRGRPAAQGRPPSATWTASARSRAPWPCEPPPWARSGSTGSCTRSSARAWTPGHIRRVTRPAGPNRGTVGAGCQRGSRRVVG